MTKHHGRGEEAKTGKGRRGNDKRDRFMSMNRNPPGANAFTSETLAFGEHDKRGKKKTCRKEGQENRGSCKVA